MAVLQGTVMAAGWANWHMCGLHELKGEAQRERHQIMTGQIMNWGQAELSALRACCGPPGWEAISKITLYCNQ
jgi:hypothetical protein